MSNDKFNSDLDKFVQSLFGNGNNKKKKNDEEAKEVKEAKIINDNKKPTNFKHLGKIATVVILFFAVLVILISNLYVVKENEYKVV
ncbi:protease modulator HflC, partial [Butyricicoccus sp. 1XD8-22]